MGLGFQSADQITPMSSSTDQILIAETSWGAENIGGNPTSAKKGDVAQYDGTDWVRRGNVCDLFNVSDIDINVVTDGVAFPASPANNDVIIFNMAATGLTWVDTNGAPLTTAALGDVGLFNGTDWVRQGNLTDLSGTAAIGDLDTAGVFAASPADTDVTIFNADAEDLTGYIGDFVPDAISDVNELIESGKTNLFYKQQPRIVEAGLREEGTLVDIPIKTGNAAMNKYASGPLDITDGLMLLGSCDGTALLYRMITQMKDPGPGQALNATDNAIKYISGDASSGVALPTTGSIATPAIPATITNPVRITIQPDATSAFATGKTYTTFKVTGTVQSGEGVGSSDRVLTETVTFLSSDKGAVWTAKMTDSYFKTVTSIVGVADDWGTVRLITVSATDTGKRVTFTPQDDALVAFWDLEFTKGTIPQLYRRIIGNEISVSISRTEAIIFALTCLGKDGRTYENFKGDTGETAKKSSAKNLGSASPETYTGWQAELSVDGVRFPLLDSTLNINQNLVNSDVISGGRYQESPPVRNGNRDTNVTGTVVFSPENNLSSAFKNNLTWENVKIILRNQPLAGFPWQTVFNFPKAQLRVSPDPASPRNERINQTFELMSFTDDIGGVLEYNIVADYANYERPRLYA